MYKNKQAVIFGTASFAEIVYFYLTQDSAYEVVAFTVSANRMEHSQFLGKPIAPFEQLEQYYPPSDYELYIAIGYSDLNRVRERYYHAAKQKGYRLLSYISSHATVWTDQIGEHCFILEDNTIQPFTNIGNNIVCWSGNHIGHHSKIGDHCFFSSHVVVSGHCWIKENCFFGVNATLRDGITVERDNVIGAGALIMKNTEAGQVYAVKGTAALARRPVSSGCI